MDWDILNKNLDILIEEHCNGVQAEVARRCKEVGRDDISNWKNENRSIPKINKIVAIAREFNVSLDWLFFDKTETEFEKEFTLIPKYEATFECGTGSFEVSDMKSYKFAFRYHWVNTVGPKNKMALFEVRGRSMSGVIESGDVVMVDRSQTDPNLIHNESIYAFREASLLKIKELRWEEKELRAYSKNNENKNSYYKIEIDGDFEIIGRVVWVGHTIK